MQGVLVSPGSRVSLVLGKVFGITTMVLVQSALFVALAPWAGYAFASIQWPALVGVIVLSAIDAVG